MKKLSILLKIGIFGLLLLGIVSILPGGKAYAWNANSPECGIHQTQTLNDPADWVGTQTAGNQFAGAIVHLYAVDAYGNKVELTNIDNVNGNRIAVNVSATNGGNGSFKPFAHLNPDKSSAVLADAEYPGPSSFGAISANCDNRSGNAMIVLGYGATSLCSSGCGTRNGTGSWALDCGVEYGDPEAYDFSMSSNDVPVSGQNGNQYTFLPGGSWTDDSGNTTYHGAAANNGFTYDFNMTYHSPAASWGINGTSKVASTAYAGQSVTFTHTLTNGGPQDDLTNDIYADAGTSQTTYLNTSGGTSPISGLNNIHLCTGGSQCAGNQGGHPAIKQPFYNGGSKPFNYPFTIPANAAAGDKFCQYVTWNPSGSGGLGAAQDAPACVTVLPPPYSASCTINSVKGTGPGGIIVAGQQYTIKATVTNTTASGLALPGSQSGNTLNLDIVINGSSSPQQIPSGIPPPNASVNISYTATAPNSVTTLAISGTPEYSPSYTLGPSCSSPQGVYEQFTLSSSPNVSLNPNQEDPLTAANTVCVTDVGASVSETVTAYLYSTPPSGSPQTPQGITPQNNNGPFTSTAQVCLYSAKLPALQAISVYNIPGPVQAGDQFCAGINFPYISGYVGPGGIDTSVSKAGSDANCTAVVNRPFFKTYDGSISADSNVNQPCTGGEIAGYNNAHYGSGDFGSGSGLSAIAYSGIYGFGSGQQRPPNSTPQPPLSLTFANTVPSSPPGSGNPSDPYTPDLGGDYGSGPCYNIPQIPSYATTSSSGGTYSINMLQTQQPQGQQSYVIGKSGGSVNVVLNGGKISVGNNLSVFVYGNVYINSNIVYSGGTAGSPWTLKNIPSLNIVTIGGNIYLSPNVTELDGIYSSQQSNAGKGGAIYTCGQNNGVSFSPMPAGNQGTKTNPTSVLFTSCNQQLTVYGVFQANRVNLMRTYGSLRNDSTTHGIKSNPTCSNAGASPPPYPLFTDTCAAEVFDFSPELYLANPSTQEPNGGAPQYQAYSQLPPIL
ncbi:MAG TPA: hypothetical protein VL989_01810 [Candidatus Sulfotelmatobacter sp.]|nr:hypothetical protein [Candidatus Sulfotelmatobacter sp.]